MKGTNRKSIFKKIETLSTRIWVIIKISIQVYDSHDFEGDLVMSVKRPLLLWQAVNCAPKHGCNVMIHSCSGWEFKKAVINADGRANLDKIVNSEVKPFTLFNGYIYSI